jgi:hypothetical protein
MMNSKKTKKKMRTTFSFQGDKAFFFFYFLSRNDEFQSRSKLLNSQTSGAIERIPV